MFFEVMNANRNMGEIGLAESSNCMNWAYKGIVIKEDFHLSYPYVFFHENYIYLIPETFQSNAIRLYRAKKFPTDWEFHSNLKFGTFVDTSIIMYQSKWWIFTCPTPGKNNSLEIYYSDRLYGPWHEHEKNPILCNDNKHSRPAGRIIYYYGKLFRFSQNCNPFYGTSVNAFEIQELTPESYEEIPYSANPILSPSGTGWNSQRMHHIDTHILNDGKWIACVDGFSC